MSKSLKKTSGKEGEEKKVKGITPKPRKGKTPKQVMKRHISDEKDVITDEEFKDLDISVDLSTDTAHEPLEIKQDPNRPKDEEKDKDQGMITPWEIIK